MAALIASARAVAQQQPIGSVGVADATVAGALEVSNGRALLVGASTVTARDHTAEVALQRGGVVRVCSTSGLHVTAGKGAVDAPLMLALDRGAIEMAARVTSSDVVMTPDLRFTMKSEGLLDLRLRVARNGDTCVENRGAAAPVLNVADQFGESSYEVKPGQHVLFEHGSLKEVVDNESEPCGCPAAPVISVADAGVNGATVAAPGSAVAAKVATDEHPFPAAQSAGLAPVSGPPQAPAGEVHAQVATTLSYGEGAPGVPEGGSGSSANASAEATNPAVPSNGAPAASSSESTAVAGRAEAAPPPPAPPPADVFHSIGRFFKRLFGGG
ncbi:nuclease [Edaphobacter modestus]|uniref:nuclease n=1 Tax=Edaphobacter modestus TaxID=388466 RepID=UPI0013EEA20F|nr:nuclease [Edaphobacter modestus]